MLISARVTVSRPQKKYFLLNSTNATSIKEEEYRDSEEDSPITRTEVAKVVEKLVARLQGCIRFTLRL